MRSSTRIVGLLVATWVLLHATQVHASDGAYGRLEGDLTLSIEAGVSETFGDEATRGESLAARAGAMFVSTVGLVAQYNDSLGSEAQPLRRTLFGGLELRPLFLGRFAENMEQGPAHADLLLDSLGIGLGLYGAWPAQRYCEARCPDYGMELSLGLELPLLPQASSPYIALRGALRWSLHQDAFAADDMASRDGSPAGLLTLSIGYHHLLNVHLVDAGDRIPR